MKTLVVTILSLGFTLSSFAEGSSNFNCAAKMNNERNRSICASSLINDATKISHNCFPKNKKPTSSDRYRGTDTTPKGN